MSNPEALTIHIDGAARGNPGPAAFAYVISRQGETLTEDKGCLGSATNNVAEYTALVRGLERATQLGARRLIIHSDSELLVKQMNGQYQVKNPGLFSLYSQAKDLGKNFDLVTLRHIPRAENRRADALCNEALDGAGGPTNAPPAVAKKSRRPAKADRKELVNEQALACLQAAAVAWARGNSNEPSADQVWDQLWSILEEHSVLSKPRKR